MTTLGTYHQELGATLADDGIPLHYGDLTAEYHGALNGSVLLDRSHEGRIFLTDDNRFELLNRMSTNKLVDMQLHEGRPTIFTSPTARILFRVVAYNRPEGLLLITEPGQGEAISNFLNRNIFYGDKVKVINIQGQTQHLALHGVTADAVIQDIQAELGDLSELSSAEITYKDTTFTIVRRKPIIGSHWAIICTQKDAVTVHKHLLEIGTKHGLKPAGSLTYNTLRIRGGRPAGRELSQDYIPLEVGLWDEVSFTKGCYTGQEIIARMESREKLAKTIVQLNLSSFVNAPATVYDNDKAVGTLTSSVESPDGEVFAMAIIKTQVSTAETEVKIGDDRIPATVAGYVGQQPSFISE
jgi:tRNA-modifying protein YgfZ